MLAGLVVMLRVIVAPNSAFVEIRDNADRYFLWSLGIVVFLGILLTVIDPWEPPPEYQLNIIATNISVGILGSFVSAAVIYLLGRLLGGNKNWKQVFSAIFYTGIIAIPILVSSMLVGQTASSASAFSGLLLWMVFLVPAIVWMAIVMVKAVKVVNGFGTAKAFGLTVLAAVITAAICISLISILIYQEIIDPL